MENGSEKAETTALASMFASIVQSVKLDDRKKRINGNQVYQVSIVK